MVRDKVLVLIAAALFTRAAGAVKRVGPFLAGAVTYLSALGGVRLTAVRSALGLSPAPPAVPQPALE